MRGVAVFVGIVVLLVGLVFGVLFTQPGNNLVRPYLEKKLEEKVEKKVHVEQFSLRFSSVVLKLSVDEAARLEVEGTFGLFDRRFDLRYGVDVTELETPAFTVRERIYLSGTAAGFLDAFEVLGAGKALGSDVTYEVAMKEGVLAGAQGEALGLGVGDLLELLGQPRVLNGRLDVRAQMNAQEEMVATLLVSGGMVDEKVAVEHFGVMLPKNTSYDLRLETTLKEQFLRGSLLLRSSLAQVNVPSFEAALQSLSWNAKGDVHVPALAQLEGIVGMPLAGDLKVDFEAKGVKEEFEAVAHTGSLGGEVRAVLTPLHVSMDAKSVSVPALLMRLGQPNYTQGLLHVEAKVQHYAKEQQRGEVKVALEKGVPNAKEIKELFDVELPKGMTYVFNANGTLKGDVFDFASALESNVGVFTTQGGVLHVDKGTLQTRYRLHVEELAKLASLTGQTLHGPLVVEGDGGFREDGLWAKGATGVIGGESSFVFEHNRLDATAKNFTFERFSQLLDVPYVFESVGNATLWFDTLKDTGAFSVTFPEGKLLESELTSLVRLATGFNMAQELYKNTLLEGTIDPAAIMFAFAMEGEQSHMRVKEGVLGREKGELNVPFDIVVQKKDLSGTVRGNMHSPSVSIRASQYLQKKLDQQIEKHVPEEAKDVVRDLLRLF